MNCLILVLLLCCCGNNGGRSGGNSSCERSISGTDFGCGNMMDLGGCRVGRVFDRSRDCDRDNDCERNWDRDRDRDCDRDRDRDRDRDARRDSDNSCGCREQRNDSRSEPRSFISYPSSSRGFDEEQSSCDCDRR